jgi:uncharacterized repeat protein (TIGR01451 family)
MKNIFNTIMKLPKITKVFLIAALSTVLIPSMLLAWGPDRPTFTIENPATYNTFNSITNNPNYGDERNFVTIKDAANTNAGGWVDEIDIVGGKDYLVRMYVHNNAAENLALIARNVEARFNVPDYRAKRIQIDGYLSSSNSSPREIWDQAVFVNDKNFRIDYIEGSATYTNNVFTSGTGLTDSIISSGSRLGYTSMNGEIPGCFQYTGYVIFKVRALEAEFTLDKTVRLNDVTDKKFYETATAQPNSKVDFQIYFDNTGNDNLSDVIVKDSLPAGLTYVAGSTYLHNSGGTKQVADGITTTGLNIGGYNSGGDAYLKFTAQITPNDNLPKCGENTLVNSATVTTAIGSKTDTATVKVTRICTDTPPPVTPPELPKTGPAENILAIMGVGAAIASIGYYQASRREFKQ